MVSAAEKVSSSEQDESEQDESEQDESEQDESEQDESEQDEIELEDVMHPINPPRTHPRTHLRTHPKAVRAALVFIGLVSLLAAAGLSLRSAAFAAVWPLGDSSTVARFLGAYLAGIGASLLWIGVSGELGAAVAGAISLTVVYTGLAITWLTLSVGGGGGGA
jgi:hypothetical protein